jgi:hypothetical protein
VIVNFESELTRRRNIHHDKKPHDLSTGNEPTVNVVAEIREGFKQVIAANELRERGRRSFQILPRLVTKDQAASYCCMCVESFAANCPVKPVRVRPGDRGLRWDIRELDAWIDSLKENSTGSENVDWLKRVSNDQSKNQGH